MIKGIHARCHMNALKRLARSIECMANVDGVISDQCMYGLALPNASADERFKKPTRLLSNLSSLKSLDVRCDRSHKHTHIQGSMVIDGRRVRVSQFTGRYPPKLCESWSRAVACSCQLS